ncbi:hypothetical protein [Micromonospora coerulea]|uniref:hypothetical protein n=1 Tax=Micromonospora coerulea TaxID=47856 RepID=UPI00190681C8|nr:hypothetical protein [Micromonospora veneta]
MPLFHRLGAALTLLGAAGFAAELFVSIRTCENTATSPEVKKPASVRCLCEGPRSACGLPFRSLRTG